MADLPRPDITVTKNTGDWGQPVVDVTIQRDGKGKSYRVAQTTETGTIADVVRKVIEDPHTAEWLPHGKRP